MKNILRPRNLVILWIIGFAVSFIMQPVLQQWFADHSYWGPNRGWQNEIAIWNIAMIAVLVGAALTLKGTEKRFCRDWLCCPPVLPSTISAPS